MAQRVASDEGIAPLQHGQIERVGVFSITDAVQRLAAASGRFEGKIAVRVVIYRYVNGSPDRQLDPRRCSAAAGEVVHDDLVEDAEHNMPGEDNVHFGVGFVHVFTAQRRRVPP